MSGIVPRSAGYVCRTCRLRQSPIPLSFQPLTKFHTPIANNQPLRRARRAASSKATPSSPKERSTVSPQSPTPPRSTPPRSVQPAQPSHNAASAAPVSREEVRGTLSGIQARVNTICASPSLPEEVQILEVMDSAYRFANLLVFGQTTAPDEEVDIPEEEEETNNKTLFSELEEPSRTSKRSAPSISATSVAIDSIPLSHRERSAQLLSETLYKLLKDPKIPISEDTLATYVRIICQLGNPEYLPEIFFLYANKPQPIPGSNPTRYRNPSPSSPKNAVPQYLSDVALDTAIFQKDLSLAVAVIDTTVGTRAFRLQKFVKKGSIPLAFVGTTPVAAYAAADWVANWQNSFDPSMAKAITLMATAAYVGTLTTIAFVAATTYNDHHERVRWSEGTPLRYRWTREEERLYFDRIAMAWGFQRKRRRGEEMGGLWEELREECGARGLVLDKSDLLPGMQ